MKEFKLWDTSYERHLTYYNDLDKILEYIKKHGIQKFHVLNNLGLEDNEITTNFVDTVDIAAKKEGLDIIFFDSEHCAYVDFFGSFCISEEFYEKYKQSINDAIMQNLYDSTYVFVSKYVYSEELIKNLVLTVETIEFDREIDVSLEIKQLLNRNYINSKQRSENGTIELSSSQILGVEHEEVLSDELKLGFHACILDYENLKLIPEHKEILIKVSGVERYRDFKEMGKTNVININDENDIYNNVCKIIETLRKNGQENKVVVDVEDKKAFYNSKLINSNFNNVEVCISYGETYKLEDLKKENDLLELMVSDIKKSSYSPFEKYLAVYNIVKKFKEYKENPEDKMSARKVFHILQNDYMVCVGYAQLLITLLEKVGIKSCEYSVSVDTSYDNGFTKEEKTIDLAGHSRVIFYINDAKYNINGFFAADPTWDNDLENDYYNHALMNFDKTKKEYRYSRLTKEELILGAKSFEEYKNNINFLLNRVKNKNSKNFEMDAYKSLIFDIFEITKKLDNEFYNKLKQSYPNMHSYEIDINKANDFFTEVGYYFVNKYGHDVPIETIVDAACVVNKDVFGFNDEQLQVYKEELLQQNIKADKKYFPYYYSEKYIK